MSNDSDDEYDDMESVTTGHDARWTYIATVLSAVMIISLPTLIIGTAAGYFAITSITQAWFGLYFLVTMMAATWAFGKETLEAVQKARGK